MNEWRIENLEKNLEVILDYRGKTPKKSDKGIITLSAKSVKMNYIDYSNIYYVSQETYNTFMTRGFPKKGDILLTTEAPLGCVAELPDDKFCLAQRLLTLRGNPKFLVNKYLLYYLQSDYGQHELLSKATGTTVQGIKRTEFSKVNIKLPPLNIQKKIAKILSDIDERIELNNKINDNLEKQIQFLYKSWFVDFIPFNKTIPLDWEEILLSDIAEFINGYSYKGKELSKSNTAMATIKNFSRNGTFNTDGYKEIVISEKVKSEHYLKNFDILVAHTDLTQNADIIGNAEMIFNKLNYQNIIFSMDLVKVIPKSKNISKFLLILLLKNSNFKNHCLSYVNGTTVLHLSKKALQEYKVFLPKNLEILNPLINLVSKIYEKFSLLSKENEKLTNLKNYLLPKLMNGEIDVEKIEL